MTSPPPPGPPPESRLDLPLLADLDADVLDAPRAAAVRAEAAADPRAQAVLQALTATRAQLAELPDPPVPPDVADRWSAALRAELAAPPRPSAVVVPSDRPIAVEPTPGRPAPDRTRRWVSRPAVLAAVALLVVLIGVGWLSSRPEADGPSSTVVSSSQLMAQALSTIGVRDAGGLDDPTRRTACLTATAPSGVAPTAPLLGARRVTFEGRAGTLLVLGTGLRGVFDVVVVDRACGPSGGTLLATTRVAPP